MDNNPPNPNSFQNPNFSSYFRHQQPIPGCTSDDVRLRELEFQQNLVDVRGSIQRELEKRRIRAQIIAEEIIQRRILEEEVRREMMMDGELGFGIGSSRGPMRVPLLTNVDHRGGVDEGRFETMVFRRDPVVAGNGYGSGNGVALDEIKEVKGGLCPPEGSKDKVIILAKPSANLANIKRKAMGPLVEGAIEDCKKQKTKVNWSCALCRITATSERGFSEHLQGRKHKAREREMVAQRICFGTNTCKPFTLPTITSTPTLKHGKEDGESSLEKVHNAPYPNPSGVNGRENGMTEAPASDKPKKKSRYFCEICPAEASSLKVFNAHKRGKKHLAKLSELNKTVMGKDKEASAQKTVMGESKEAEMGAEENKERTEGEQEETNRDHVDIDENRVEDKEKVLEIVGGETVVPKTKKGMEEAQVETDRDDVDSDVNRCKDKETVLETVGGETLAPKTKEGMGEEQVKTNTDDVVSDENRVKDKEKVLKIVGDQTVAPKTKEEFEEQVETNRDPVVARSGCESPVGNRSEYESGNGVTSHEIKEVKGVIAPAEGSKDKLFILAKPSMNLADIKRKAMTPPVAGVFEVFKKQKTKEDWSCALCRITATSEQGFIDHLRGRKHTLATKGMKRSIYFCEICEVRVYSLNVFNGHKRGKKHLAKLSELSKTDDATPLEASAQKALMRDNKETEMGAEETGKKMEGKQVEANKDDVDIDENQVEEKDTVLEIVGGEAVAPMTKEGMEEQVDTNIDDVDGEENLVEDKDKILEIVGGENVVPKTKEGMELEQVETNTDDVDREENRVEDREKVLEIVGGEIVDPKTKEGIEEQVEPNKDDVDCDENRVDDKDEVLEIVCAETVDPNTKEGLEHEHVETNTDDVDSDENRVEDMEKVLEIVGGKSVVPKAEEGIEEKQVETNRYDIDSDENRVEDKEKVLEIVCGETVDPKAEEGMKQEQVETNTDVDNDENRVEDKDNALEIVSDETMAPKNTDLIPVCNEVDC